MSSAQPRGPVDSSRVPRYAGPATFARLPRLDEVGSADVAVVGVPFDTGVSYRPGARFGGNAIREASRLLRPYNPALQASPFASHQVADAGDLAVNPYSIEEAIENAVARARKTLRNLDWFEVTEVRGHLGDDGSVAHYQVTLKLGFKMED